MEYSPTEDTMGERATQGTFRLWLSLTGNRLLVTLVLLLFVVVGLFVVSLLYGSSLTAAIGSGDTIETLLSTLIGGIITGTTLVVTISQLVISQELGALGDQQERIDDAMTFRERIADLTAKSPPPSVASTCSVLLEQIESAAVDLSDAVDGTADESLSSEIQTFTTDVADHAASTQQQLDDAQFGTFSVIVSLLNFNYSIKLQAIEELQYHDADRLNSSATDALDDLEAGLRQFAAMREHIKTLYFQWELMDLSRSILYVALVALCVVGGSLLFLGTATVSGTIASVESLLVVTVVVFTIGVSPFVLFIAYVLRIVTMAKRTLAIGPLVLRPTEY